MKRFLGVVFALLVAPCAALAHHSAIRFDLTIRDNMVSGVVKEFVPANPHTKIVLEITDAKGTRDVEFLMEMGFAVYARYATPRDITGYWMVDALDVPIKIGKVSIAPHDYLLADRDGIVILPRERAAEIVATAAAAIGTENQIRTAILGGMDPQAAYLKFGKF